MDVNNRQNKDFPNSSFDFAWDWQPRQHHPSPPPKKKLLSETKSYLGRRVQVILNFCDCVSKVVYDISTLQASIHDKDQVNKFC